MLLINDYEVVPPLVKFLFEKQGLKAKSRIMISQLLGQLGI